MSDNSTLPATGDVIAAEDIGGVKYQLVKHAYGVHGIATLVSPANPLPVSNASLPLPAGASTEATLAGLNPYRGTSSYFGGAAGAAVIPSGARVVSLSAHSTTGGTITIFGGASVVVPANNGFSDGWSGFVGPGSIVFTGTDSYYVVVNQ